jgi:hypothetical protein
MTLAYQSLVMLVLLVSGSVAMVPALLSGSTPRPSPPLRQALSNQGLWIVQNPKGEWFIQGKVRSSTDLAKDLQTRGRQQSIHYLPSDALPFEKVASSLRWLRSLAPGSVVLELPPLNKSLQ